jgi:hypothetical protein
MLIIRDGWGINPGGKKSREQNGDATLLASTPFTTSSIAIILAANSAPAVRMLVYPKAKWATQRSDI